MLLKKGSKGELVKTMQSLLKSIGFDINVDGIFGSGTERILRLFQEDALLKIDGICGNQTYQCLIDASKKATQNYKESIVWLNPKDLKLVIVNDVSSSLISKFKSFINGTYFWNNPKDSKNYAIGWLFSEGVNIQSNNITQPRGTFLVLKSGEVICKRMTNAQLLEYKKKDNIWFCIQGFDAINIDFKYEGLDQNEVGRKCIRPILGYCGNTGKVLIAMFNGDFNDAKAVLKKYNCVGIGLDGGGSSNFIIGGKKIYSTSRVLQNIVYW